MMPGTITSPLIPRAAARRLIGGNIMTMPAMKVRLAGMTMDKVNPQCKHVDCRSTQKS